MKSIYVIGSLRNPKVPSVASSLRSIGLDAFDDWYSAGPEADDYWKEYEIQKGNDFVAALEGYAARHVFEFDKSHLDRCDAALLVLPAGKSGHLELGYAIGSGKRGFILLPEETERFDVMYGFAERVFRNEGEMLEYFKSSSKEPLAGSEGTRVKDVGVKLSPNEPIWQDYDRCTREYVYGYKDGAIKRTQRYHYAEQDALHGHR